MRRLFLCASTLLALFAAPPAFADESGASDRPSDVSAVPHADATPVPTESQGPNEACKECETKDAPRVARPIDERWKQASRGEEPDGSEWYGWQTLLVDGASIGLTWGGMTSWHHDHAMLYLGMGTYALGGPTVHLAHGRPGAAAGSLLLRVGLGFGGMFAGASADHDGESFAGAAYGLLAGMLAASAIDAAALGHEDVVRPAERPQSGLSMSPTVSASRHAGAVGLAGSF